MAGQTRTLDLANVGAGWVDLTDMNHDRIAPGLAASNDKVYAFGGASKRFQKARSYRGSYWPLAITLTVAEIPCL